MNSVTVSPSDDEMEVKFAVQIWQMKLSRNPVVFLPRPKTISKTFKMADLVPFLRSKLESGMESCSNPNEILLPSYHSLDSYLDLVRDSMCIVMNDAKDDELML